MRYGPYPWAHFVRDPTVTGTGSVYVGFRFPMGFSVPSSDQHHREPMEKTCRHVPNHYLLHCPVHLAGGVAVILPQTFMPQAIGLRVSSPAESTAMAE